MSGPVSPLSRCPPHTGVPDVDPGQRTFRAVAMLTPALQWEGSSALANHLCHPCNGQCADTVRWCPFARPVPSSRRSNMRLRLMHCGESARSLSDSALATRPVPHPSSSTPALSEISNHPPNSARTPVVPLSHQPRNKGSFFFPPFATHE